MNSLNDLLFRKDIHYGYSSIENYSFMDSSSYRLARASARPEMRKFPAVRPSA
ncbi:MAG: hypothetical protein ACI9CE_000791 [Flavobacterium sp.]|jgi:hypothetical protein